MENHLVQEALLKPADVARILCVSRSFAYQLLQRGDIPTIHIRSTIRIHPKDLQGYIETQRTKMPGQQAFYK